MAQQLADELLKEILTPPLLVPDELFADTGPVSPFSKATYSAADVLLVCKRWMRVATPALYHTVVIRSSRQAQALAGALKRNPDFGRYIRRLRVEGAYGASLGQIVPVSPNITDFCFSLSIWTDASHSGLLKLLAAVNPTRVIFTTAHPKPIKNKNHKEVLEKLCSCIRLWTNLETFHFSGSEEPPEHSVEIERYPAIAFALARAPSLRSVHLFCSHLDILHAATALRALATSSHIRSFHLHAIYSSHDATVTDVLSTLPLAMRARTTVIFPSSVAAFHDAPLEDATCPNPFYVPMCAAPEDVRAHVWSLIFGNAVQRTTVQYIRGYDKVWFDVKHFDPKTASSLMLVSRAFLAVVVPLLCRHVAAASETSFSTLLRYMHRFAVPGTSVRSLSVKANRIDVAPLLEKTTQLRECSITTDMSVLVPLGRAAGSTLRELYIAHGGSFSRSSDHSAALFFPFTSLHKVRWTMYTEWTVQDEVVLDPPPAALAHLSILDLRVNEEPLIALAPLAFPSLTELHCERPSAGCSAFLRRHGSKIRKLGIGDAEDIDLSPCTALEELEFTSMNREVKPTLLHGHPCLRALRLGWSTIDQYTGRQTQAANWEELFKLITRDRFPALQEVQLTYESELWPASEHAFKKSPWPKHAEALSARGITLLDRTGRAWRPRLSGRR